MCRRFTYPFIAVVVLVLLMLISHLASPQARSNGEGLYRPGQREAQKGADGSDQPPEVRAGHTHEDRTVTGGQSPEADSARRRDAGTLATGTAVEEEHLSHEQDALTEELTGEHISRFEHGGLSLGNPDYFTGKILAARARATEYSARVKPIGEIKLLDEIEVAPSEVQAKAETIKMTAVVTQRTSETRSGNASLGGHGDDVVVQTDTVDIKEQLDQGTLSMLTYDQALLGALNAIVDGRILDSFFVKQALAPRKDQISFRETWDLRGLMLTVLVSGAEYAAEAFPGMGKNEYLAMRSQIHDDISSSVQLEIGLRSFAATLDTFVSPTERQQYFPAQGGLNRLSLLQFLKSKAEISEEMPAEMRDLVSHRGL